MTENQPLPLSFGYVNDYTAEVARIGADHVAVVERDQFASNPLEDDYLPRMIVGAWERHGYYMLPGSRDVSDAIPEFTEDQLREHGARIAAVFDCRTLLALVSEHSDRRWWARGEAVDAVNESVAQAVYSFDGLSDKLNLCEILLDMAGATVEQTRRTGYSPGDGLTMLAWADDTDDITAEHREDALASAFDTMAAYAFGDTYEFAVFKYEPGAESLEELIASEFDALTPVDTCSGFYGTDHEKSGLADAIRETVG